MDWKNAAANALERRRQPRLQALPIEMVLSIAPTEMRAACTVAEIHGPPHARPHTSTK